VLIVSAGPSLDRNIRELRGIEDYCLILAVDYCATAVIGGGCCTARRDYCGSTS
jgi:hypothetical protein